MAEAQKEAATGTETKGAPSVPTRDVEGERHPIATLRDEMDRLFDDFFSGFPLMPFRRRRLDVDPWRRFQGMFEATFPTVEVKERDKDYCITAELPGMDEKDIDVSLANGVLTLQGEKKQERTEGEEKGSYYVSERRYGSFQRSFRLPEDADPERIDAHFKNGVLEIVIPKSAEAQGKRKKISVKSS
jgi:HSP20 family protein